MAIKELLAGPKCARILFYAINIFVIVSACLGLGVGIWLSSDVSSLATAFNPALDPSYEKKGLEVVEDQLATDLHRIQIAANVIIASSAFQLLMGFFAFGAAYKSSRAMIITYIVILGLVIVLQLGVGVALAVEKPTNVRSASRLFERAVNRYDYVETTLDTNNRIVAILDTNFSRITLEPTILVNVIQTWIGCCGDLEGYTDFMDSPYWEKSGGVAPVYCCKLKDRRTLEIQDRSCLKARTTDNSWMNKGCENKIAEIDDSVPSLKGISLGIGILNIFAVMAAVYLLYTLTWGYREL